MTSALNVNVFTAPEKAIIGERPGRGGRPRCRSRNQCPMMVAASTPESRVNWIADLDRLAALNPKIAVAGHKKAGVADTPDAIESTKRYLVDFGRLKESASGERELYDAMTGLYPDWASNQTWLMFGLG
jgi:hypothetical protein